MDIQGEMKAQLSVIFVGLSLHRKIYALPLTPEERLRTVELLQDGLEAIKGDLRAEIQTKANENPPSAEKQNVEPRTEQAAEETGSSPSSST